MTRFLKTLLIWMLAFALPAQALGSVIKLSCGPTHHVAVPAAVSGHSHHEIHHKTADHAAHDHESTANAHHGEAAAEPDDDSTQYKSATCSACATCCASAAVVHSDLTWMPGYRNSFIFVPSPFLSFFGHVPAGLERPPRSFVV
jgi:hypothetical protein